MQQFLLIIIIVLVLILGISNIQIFRNLKKIKNLKKTANKEKHYEKDLEMAKRVQEALMQFNHPSIPGIKLVKRCIPAQSIGGDFYMFSTHDSRHLSGNSKPDIPGVIEYIDSRDSYLGIAIGDVAGHGISSALVMALSSGLINEISKTVKSPAEVLKNVNSNLINYIENSQISYVTAFYATLDITKKIFTYAKAGHPSPIIFHKNKSIDFLDIKGVFLGMYPNETYPEKSIVLTPGDRILFYTDGIIEAKNKFEDNFELERLITMMQDNDQTPIQDLLNKIFNEVNSFTQNHIASDDQTIIILEIE